MKKKLKDLSDNKLALKLQEDYDPMVFNVLLDRYQNRIVQQCRLLVKNPDTAEDLTQEILIKIFMKIKSFKADSQFSTWVYSITHNTCIDFIRKRKSLYLQLTSELAEAFEEEQEEHLDFTFAKFDEMLENMEPDTRTVLILKYKQNLSVKEIQDQLNISESAVKMRLLRARDKMRRYLLKE